MCINWKNLKKGERGAIGGAIFGVASVVAMLLALSHFQPVGIYDNTLLAFPLLLTIVLLSTLTGIGFVKIMQRLSEADKPWSAGFKSSVLAYGVIFIIFYSYIAYYLWKAKGAASMAWVDVAVASMFILSLCGGAAVISISKIQRGRLSFISSAYVIIGAVFLLGAALKPFSAPFANTLLACAGVTLLTISVIFFVKLRWKKTA